MIIPDHVRARVIELRKLFWFSLHFEDADQYTPEQYEKFALDSLKAIDEVLEHESAVPVSNWDPIATDFAAIHLLMVDTCTKAYEHQTGKRETWALTIPVDWFLPSNN